MKSNQVRLVGLALCGAALLGVVARHYRIDTVRCAGWPPLMSGLGWGLVYLVAVALLSVAWLGMVRLAEQGRLSVGRVLLLGLPVHLMVLWGPPFLSDDPLFYAAVGRSMAQFHCSPSALLRDCLPASDPFLVILWDGARQGNSAYFAGWNALSALIARLSGADLSLHLRCYQLVGLMAMLSSAALSGLAAGARGAALLFFCPLAIIEGTQNGHNDDLLALSTAAFVLCVTRRRSLLALLAILAGLLIKASALLLLGLYVGQHLLSRLPRGRLRGRSRKLILILLAAVLSVAALLLLAPLAARFTSLIGSPADPFDHCTRSIECLPRVLLRWVFGLPTAAWAVGLCFRAAGGVLLLYCALRASTDGRTLHWAAVFLFFYYLYLHGWSQSWYLLPLLPLLPYAGERMYRAMVVLCVSEVAYYALLLPWNCVTRPVDIAVVDLAEGLIVVVPPTVVLLRHGRAAGGPHRK